VATPAGWLASSKAFAATGARQSPSSSPKPANFFPHHPLDNFGVYFKTDVAKIPEDISA
jgi:hypothetical protein